MDRRGRRPPVQRQPRANSIGACSRPSTGCTAGRALRAPCCHRAPALPVAVGLCALRHRAASAAQRAARRQLASSSRATSLGVRPSRLGAGAGPDRAQLRRAHRLRPPGLRLHRQAPAARPSRVRLVLAYAVANNVGFAMLSGASVRYRFYTRWGVTAEELSRIVFSYSVTFWLGLLVLGGISLGRQPAAPRRECRRRPLAPRRLAADAVPSAYVGCQPPVRRPPSAPRRLRACRCRRRHRRRAAASLSAVDWALAGAVLYVLLPPGGLPFLAFLGAFLVAILLGMASHVPGGRRRVRRADGPAAQAVPDVRRAAAGAGRVPRGVLPAAPRRRAGRPGRSTSCASAARRRGAGHARCSASSPSCSRRACSAVFTFLAGVVLLFSGATPAAPDAWSCSSAWLPLGVIEASHFLGSIAGAALLLLSQGLARRLDAAYYLTAAAIGAGIAASLLKGLDYEEADPADVVLVVLLRARPALRSPRGVLRYAILRGVDGGRRRRARRVDLARPVRLQARRLLERALVAVRAARRGLAIPAGSVGAAVVVLLFAVSRLVRPAPHEAAEPTERDLDAAGGDHRRQTATSPHLVYLRDKALLFDDGPQRIHHVRRPGAHLGGARRSGRTGRRVQRSDPPVPRALRRFGGTPVFYEIGTAHCTSLRGFRPDVRQARRRSARRPLAFSLEGPRAARYRQAIRRLENDGGPFGRGAAGVPASCRRCARSDDWLKTRAGTEKGFSLGFFDATTWRGSRWPSCATARLWRSRTSGRVPTRGALGRPDALPTAARRRA